MILAAVLFLPATAATQTRRSSKTRLSRDEQIEAALRKRTQKIQDQYCRDLVRVANWAALQGLKKDAGALVDRIRKINQKNHRMRNLKSKTTILKIRIPLRMNRMRKRSKSNLILRKKMIKNSSRIVRNLKKNRVKKILNLNHRNRK